MKRRPWILVVLAALHIISPIGNIVLNAVVSKKPILDYFGYAMSADYMVRNWPIVVAPILAGIAIYACKKWSFFVFLGSMFALFVFSYQGYMSKTHFIGPAPLILIYIVNILVVGYFLLPTVRMVYFDRRLRWWETKPRFKMEQECEFVDENQGTHKGVIGNFSEGGVFIKTTDFPADSSTIDIKFEYGGGAQEFKGRVIQHGQQNRIGFGVQFEHGKDSTKAAKKIALDLDKKGFRLRTSELVFEDSFAYWASTLFKTGKGLVPEKKS